MKNVLFRPGRLLVVGLAMLILPLCMYEYHPGPAGKIWALRCLAVSLVGLSLVALSLAMQLSARRERLKDKSA